MTRNKLIALASGMAIALAAPLAAQGMGQGSAGQTSAAQPSTPTGSAATAPANGDDPNAQATDAKADTKAKNKSSGGAVVKAGPNAGQVIGKTKKPKGDADAAAKSEDQSAAKCANPPCG